MFVRDAVTQRCESRRGAGRRGRAVAVGQEEAERGQRAHSGARCRSQRREPGGIALTRVARLEPGVLREQPAHEAIAQQIARLPRHRETQLLDAAVPEQHVGMVERAEVVAPQAQPTVSLMLEMEDLAVDAERGVAAARAALVRLDHEPRDGGRRRGRRPGASGDETQARDGGDDAASHPVQSSCVRA